MRLKTVLAASVLGAAMALAARPLCAAPKRDSHFENRPPLISARFENFRRQMPDSAQPGMAALSNEQRVLGPWGSKNWAATREQYRRLMMRWEAGLESIIPVRKLREGTADEADLGALASYCAFFLYHTEGFVYDDSMVRVAEALNARRLGPETAAVLMLDMLLRAGVDEPKLAYVDVMESKRGPWPYALLRVGGRYYDTRQEWAGGDSVITASFAAVEGRPGWTESRPEKPLASGIIALLREADRMAEERLGRGWENAARLMRDAAIGVCAQALMEEPGAPSLHYWAAALEGKNSRRMGSEGAKPALNRALAHLKKTLGANSGHYPSWMLRARIEIRLGKKDAARRSLGHALKNAPDNAAVQEEIRQMRETLRKK